MAKRRRNRKPKPAEVYCESFTAPNPLARHCPNCGGRWTPCPDRPKTHGYMQVWGRRQLQGPPCCDGATLPADHWHCGCSICGHRWIESHDTVSTRGHP